MSFDSSSPPSSPSGCSDFEDSSSPPPSYEDASSANSSAHKATLKSLQMKFTYLREPRKRTRTSPEQLDTLVSFFETQPNPSMKQRKQLAEKTGMTPRSIQVWFQNRRAKFRIPGVSAATPAAAPKKSSSSSTLTAPSFLKNPPAPHVPYIPFQSFLKQEPVMAQRETCAVVVAQAQQWSHVPENFVPLLLEHDDLPYSSPVEDRSPSSSSSPLYSDGSLEDFDLPEVKGELFELYETAYLDFDLSVF